MKEFGADCLLKWMTSGEQTERLTKEEWLEEWLEDRDWIIPQVGDAVYLGV